MQPCQLYIYFFVPKRGLEPLFYPLFSMPAYLRTRTANRVPPNVYLLRHLSIIVEEIIRSKTLNPFFE